MAKLAFHRNRSHKPRTLLGEAQLGRLRPMRGQGPRSVVKPSQGAPWLTGGTGTLMHTRGVGLLRGGAGCGYPPVTHHYPDLALEAIPE